MRRIARGGHLGVDFLLGPRTSFTEAWFSDARPQENRPLALPLTGPRWKWHDWCGMCTREVKRAGAGGPDVKDLAPDRTAESSVRSSGSARFDLYDPGALHWPSDRDWAVPHPTLSP